MAAGCLWRSYDEIMRVHLDVLSGMARKVASKAEADRRPTPNDITELIYPLERARQFAGQNRARAERESYRSFEELLGRYAEFVAAIDAARVDEERWRHLRARLPEEERALETLAARVRTALEREG